MSTDEKPTNCGINSLFYELDTGNFYYFNGVWKKVSSKVQLQDTGPSGTIEITENDVYDVTDYDYADVNVPGVIPTGTFPITENGNVNVTNYATAEVNVNYVTVNFNLPALTRSTPTGLSQARSNLVATTVAPAGGSNPQSGYALFAGGYFSSQRVDAFDTTLTRSIPTELSQSKTEFAATTVGTYALFGGGVNNGNYSNGIDAYDQTLIRSTPTDLLSQARAALAATRVGNYCLFGGGRDRTSVWRYFSTVDGYDQTLTKVTPLDPLSQVRAYLAATAVAPTGGSSPQSGYALFGGGYSNSNDFAVVDAYDQTLTRVTPPAPLSKKRLDPAATAIATVGGGYALFAGGNPGSSLTGYLTVDAYDTSLTRTMPAGLSQARCHLAAATVGNYALFGGGRNGTSSTDILATVDAYDTSLTRTMPAGLSQARAYLAAATVGNYALFGGGDGKSKSSVVDAYTPVSSYNIQLFPETKYNFNNSGEQISPNMQTITMEPPIVGYIKIKNTTVT